MSWWHWLLTATLDYIRVFSTEINAANYRHRYEITFKYKHKLDSMLSIRWLLAKCHYTNAKWHCTCSISVAPTHSSNRTRLIITRSLLIKKQNKKNLSYSQLCFYECSYVITEDFDWCEERLSDERADIYQIFADALTSEATSWN